MNELQIAKEFLKLKHYLVVSSCHKETCQRFLEFLKKLSLKCVSNSVVIGIIDREIEDKEKAIKHYEENGI